MKPRRLLDESQRTDGLVRRVGLGQYLAREEAEYLGLLATPRLRVQQAAEQLAATGLEEFAVQQLLAHVNRSLLPPFQRSVYYGLSQLVDDSPPVLLRVDWGHYALAAGTACSGRP